ncbi:hypothetical protein Ancab_007279 [Ancistrocladus abbreviatus]
MGTSYLDQKSTEFNSSSKAIAEFSPCMQTSASEEKFQVFPSGLKSNASNLGESFVHSDENGDGFKSPHHKSMELNTFSKSISESPSDFQISVFEEKVDKGDDKGVVSFSFKNRMASLRDPFDDDGTSTSIDNEIRDHKSMELYFSSKLSASGEKVGILSPSLKIKVPGAREQLDEDDNGNNDGCKTPTSIDHKIPLILKCPPAPKKPKRPPSLKRRAFFHQKIVLDASKEIELLFPPGILADLGGKIKKVRKVNLTNVA